MVDEYKFCFSVFAFSALFVYCVTYQFPSYPSDLFNVLKMSTNPLNIKNILVAGEQKDRV